LTTHVANEGILNKCEECGKSYQPGTGWSRFCSEGCRWENWKQTHVRLHRADLFAAFGKDWQARINAAKAKRKAAQ
jgi:hypothetical protein